MKMKDNRASPYLLFMLVACLLLIPFFLLKGMLIGSDAIFHFNRFYDTAMQIKEGNIQYFLSMYGFQQSGRIVNAFYGPFFSYIQGILVLCSGTWFRYQLVSNFFLYWIAASSMYLLLKRNGIGKKSACFWSLLYLSTFAIQYWILSQGFTSWGAALMPLGLIPLREMFEEHRLPFIQMGVVMALLLQVHVLSTLMLALIYLISFGYCWFQSKQKKELLLQAFAAAGIFFLLTANIWASYLHLYSSNHIHPPFVNRSLHLNTINHKSANWLVYPIFFSIFMIAQPLVLLLNWKKSSVYQRFVVFLSLFFLFLSTSWMPWQFLIAHDSILAKAIQFPFRFFVPYLVLLFLSLALLMEQQSGRWMLKENVVMFSCLFVACAQTMGIAWHSLNQWKSEDLNRRNSLHTFVDASDQEALRQSFFQKDLSLSLAYWQKSTPDYLPIIKTTETNKYKLYEKYVLNTEKEFQRQVRENQLHVSWESQQEESIYVPIVKYQQTELIFNGKKLSEEDYQCTEIGTLILQAKKGENQLTVFYRPPFYIPLIIYATMINWFLVLLIWGWKKRKTKEISKGATGGESFKR